MALPLIAYMLDPKSDLLIDNRIGEIDLARCILSKCYRIVVHKHRLSFVPYSTSCDVGVTLKRPN